MESLQITENPFLDPNRQYKIDHVGNIDKQTFKILVGFFTTLSTLAALIRITFRLTTLRKLYLDDWLVIFATGCFLSATGVLFSYHKKMYLVETLMRGVDIAFTIEELWSLMDIMKWNNIFLCLAWTANFSIKFSFLAFFYGLIRNVSVKLNRYYWSVVVYTGLSWAFAIVEPFILCPHFDTISPACPDHTLNIVLVSFLFIFDITTDIMIASIPIILLRMSHLHPVQKIRIGTFLCLSLVIVIVSLARLVGGLYHSRRSKYEFSMQWTFTFLHVEAAIAVLMGSISALRTVFTTTSNNESQEDKGPIVFLYKRFVSLTNSWKASHTSKVNEQNCPQIPDGNRTKATLQGLRTYIRRYNHSQGHMTLSSGTSELEDYHQFKRREINEDPGVGESGLPILSTYSNTNTSQKQPNLEDSDPWITKPQFVSPAV